MEPTLADVLRGLDEATEFAKSYRFEVTDDYRRLLERVEALPRNQSGADKSGRWYGRRRGSSAVTSTNVVDSRP